MPEEIEEENDDYLSCNGGNNMPEVEDPADSDDDNISMSMQ